MPDIIVFPLEITDHIFDLLVAQPDTSRVLATTHPKIDPPFPTLEPETIKFRTVSKEWRYRIDDHKLTQRICDLIENPALMGTLLKRIDEANKLKIYVLSIDASKHKPAEIESLFRACQGSLVHLYIRSQTLSELPSVLPKLKTLYVQVLPSYHPLGLNLDRFPLLESLYIPIGNPFWRTTAKLSIDPETVLPPLVELSLRSTTAHDVLKIVSECPSVQRLLFQGVFDNIPAGCPPVDCPNLLFLQTDGLYTLKYLTTPRLRILHVDVVIYEIQTLHQLSIQPSHELSEFLSRCPAIETLATSVLPYDLVPTLKEFRLIGVCYHISRSLDLLQSTVSPPFLASFANVEKFSIVHTRLDTASQHIVETRILWKCLFGLLYHGYRNPVYFYVPGYSVHYRWNPRPEFEHMMSVQGLPDVYINGERVRDMPREPIFDSRFPGLMLKESQIEDYVL
ncbi:hypothetical protein CVT24_005447 [Panaeolus cyanescens]|uniref:F-box domain-containing protein n=1 Tax=Panaeolus cyanescens TaxID=181874 RepID=A0A409YC58_9AGAR|nr:hypothetical protein CVT24_005447 [Panaeolus cyanescens]